MFTSRWRTTLLTQPLLFAAAGVAHAGDGRTFATAEEAQGRLGAPPSRCLDANGANLCLASVVALDHPNPPRHVWFTGVWMPADKASCMDESGSYTTRCEYDAIPVARNVENLCASDLNQAQPCNNLSGPYATSEEARLHMGSPPGRCLDASGDNHCVAALVPGDVRSYPTMIWVPGGWVPRRSAHCIDHVTAQPLSSCDIPGAVADGAPPIVPMPPVIPKRPG